MKSCGKCGKPVPITARVGDTCPYCGAQWGFERGGYLTRPLPPRTPPIVEKMIRWVLLAGLLLTLLMPFILRHSSPAKPGGSAVVQPK